jgi:hypothetical protein
MINSKVISVLFLLALLFACSNCQAQGKQLQDTAKLVSQQPSTQGDSNLEQNLIIGRFVKTNEDGDYWLFYITDSTGKEITFIYNSENILRKKKSFAGKTVKVRYIDKEFEDAGSGDKITEKFLQSVEIQK